MPTEPATPEQVAEIRERLAKATPGVVGYSKGGICGWQTYRIGVQFTESGGMRLGDAVFHSYAPADVAALLALVDQQTAEIARLQAFAASVTAEGAGRLD